MSSARGLAYGKDAEEPYQAAKESGLPVRNQKRRRKKRPPRSSMSPIVIRAVILISCILSLASTSPLGSFLLFGHLRRVSWLWTLSVCCVPELGRPSIPSSLYSYFGNLVFCSVIGDCCSSELRSISTVLLFLCQTWQLSEFRAHFGGFWRVEKFKSSPLIAAHPSWSLIKSLSELFSDGSLLSRFPSSGMEHHFSGVPTSTSSRSLTAIRIRVRHHSFEAVRSCRYRLPLCQGTPSSCTTSSWYVYVMRTVVQVRRVRQGPPPDPMPFVRYKMGYASTSSSLLGACWCIPAGEEVLLCCRF